MKKTLLTRIGTTIFIAVCILAVNDLWESEFKNEHASANKNDENVLKVDVDDVLKNQYNELVYNATGEKSYLAVVEAVNKKIEEEKVRRAEEQKKQQVQQSVNVKNSSNIWYEGTFNVTFYTAGIESTGKSKGDKGYGITASGTTVQEGRTVACPKNIPFGTKVYVEGFGERVCEDRGGAINNAYKLDVYVKDYSKAIKLGRQYLHVKVYK